MLPVLKASAGGEVKISDVVTLLGQQLDLSEGDLSELLPSGKQTTFANRVNWAKSYLGKAGLITLAKRGHFEISERGKAVLAAPPAAINVKFLESFPEFKQFKDGNGQPAVALQQESVNLSWERSGDKVYISAPKVMFSDLNTPADRDRVTAYLADSTQRMIRVFKPRLEAASQKLE